MSENVIELKGIRKVYKTGDEDTVALDGIDLDVKKGEFVAVTGPSGSGKSTLMNVIGLLDRQTAGNYKLAGQDVSQLGGGKRAEIRNKEIGFVFQQFNLLARTTVRDNVMLPTIYGKDKRAAARADKLIKDVGLGDRAGYRSNQLSGGQIQRVAIARALVMEPSLILADEPTGNLDTKRSHEIMELLKDINAKGATIVLITHEASVAGYASRVLHIIDGKIASESTGEAE
jgi:putative ABC transport system ATP-binding protein